MIQHVELIESGDTADWRSDVKEHYKEYLLLTLQVIPVYLTFSLLLSRFVGFAFISKVHG